MSPDTRQSDIFKISASLVVSLSLKQHSVQMIQKPSSRLDPFLISCKLTWLMLKVSAFTCMSFDMKEASLA